MKMFKRFAAVLLAGVMVLAMLTACGSDANAEAKTVEDAYLQVFNTLLGEEGGSIKNNADLQSSAKAYLDEALNDDGTLKTGKSFEKVLNEVVNDQIKPDSNGNISIVIVMPDSTGKAPMGLTSENVSKLNDADAVKAAAEQVKAQLQGGSQSIDFTAAKEAIKAMGVGSVKKGDKYYVAVALTVNASVFA